MTEMEDFVVWNEAMARKYNPDAFITRSGAIVRWIEARRLGATAAVLDCRPGDKILDAGCGAGNLLEKLKGFDVTGVDISETLLAQARARISGQAGACVMFGNAEALPFPDATFDRAVCSEILEHVLNPETVLAELRRVVKPGGRIVLTVPNEGLISLTKKLVLLTGLKKAVSGDYEMSDDMLSEWHRHEITLSWAREKCRGSVLLRSVLRIPFFFLPFHYVLVLEVKK
ncbi:MAG: hypothetical protein A2X32_08985 [Elusimicrobia bacterium GWC2_64_44]|nr:MAG: hypothetical protein A2X32_08985 [Elusimicrobia bacterium GWC2_64_44]